MPARAQFSFVLRQGRLHKRSYFESEVGLPRLTSKLEKHCHCFHPAGVATSVWAVTQLICLAPESTNFACPFRNPITWCYGNQAMRQKSLLHRQVNLQRANVLSTFRSSVRQAKHSVEAGALGSRDALVHVVVDWWHQCGALLRCCPLSLSTSIILLCLMLPDSAKISRSIRSCPCLSCIARPLHPPA